MAAFQNIQNNENDVAISPMSSRTSIVASQFTSGVFSDAISTIRSNLNLTSVDKLTADFIIDLENETIEKIENVLREMGDRFLKLKEENIELKESMSVVSAKIKSLFCLPMCHKA